MIEDDLLNKGCGADFEGFGIDKFLITSHMDMGKGRSVQIVAQLVCDVDRCIPFRDSAFEDVRCFEVLEHIHRS